MAAPNPVSSRRPSSVAESATTVGGRRSVSTSGRPTPSGSTLRPVVTAPPWAKDEPESPMSDNFSPERSPRPSGTSTTHVPSIASERPSVSTENLGGHHRWNFALPRPRPKLKRRRSSDSSSESSKESPIRERRPQAGPSRPSRSRWPNTRKRTSPEVAQDSQLQPADHSSSRPSRSQTLRLELPLPPPKAPFTLSHNKTPGWDSPWTPRVPEQAYAGEGGHPFGPDTEAGASQGLMHGNNSSLRPKEVDNLDQDGLSGWGRRKKNLRSFLLYNNYIPLVSRLVNMTFTTITLALAIRIRVIEQDHRLLGAVGSSPVLAIIFAPLTLVHVMVAIYLEYFGRPLGLWRTSAKLAHTLSEVLFICAWSAELSLCFDNYFTSPLHCAPHSAVKWYSDLPPFESPLGNNATGDLVEDAHTLCDYQLDLIGVVTVALILYATNLVISLFRIFEKVKVGRGYGR